MLAPQLPVTVLSGFLGAGKTTLLNHILRADHGYRIALIVNDLGEVNIDASVLSHDAMSQVDAKIVEMQNGCICCTLREDLLVEVARLAREGRFDYLIIESTGVSEPLPVAETFTFTDSEGVCLGDLARIDTMVTVVDALNFLHDWQRQDSLAQLGVAISADDERDITGLLIEQVEFADVLVITKCDLVSPDERDELAKVLYALNPRAKQVRADFGRVEVSDVLHTGRFLPEIAASAPQWLQEARGTHVPETQEYGIRSAVFRARRPFHPERLYDVFADDALWHGVLRSKGYVWLATRMDLQGYWSQAGQVATLGGMAMWWAALPPEERELDPQQDQEIRETQWVEPFGDRRVELVFIGTTFDRDRLFARLEAALLDSTELAGGPSSWATLTDPLPSWTE